MIDIYTERKDSKDWIFYNDLYFNLNTGNEEMVLLIWANENYDPKKPDTNFIEV